MLEFNCMLVRRTMFERVGPLDERLRTANEHSDFSMQVRDAGGTLVFEPAAEVNYLLPLPFPVRSPKPAVPIAGAGIRRRNRATIAHFR